MTIRLTHLSLIAALAAAPAFAQDDQGEATEGETTTEAPETEAPAAESGGETADTGQDGNPMGLSGGEPVGPEAFVKSEEGAWQVQCVRFPDGEEGDCRLYQLLEAGDGQPLAEALVFKLPDGMNFAAGMNVVVPLETLLTERLTLAVDGGQAKRYEFTTCRQDGCVARFGLTNAELNQLKAGVAARISIVPVRAPDQQVSAEMSLSGFTAGFDSLEATPLPAQQPQQ
ncbi:invasion associated locus B family protein [Roseivivax halodurans JCM 10272]|uniref:Invasion associated locus B family protein n=1 Tax=Roseivivax halodurans JCM 10272 TaxID=1449350 RepID=X7EKK1_9RHOB|nr:invasion associated locus B family protein [Roseivivax halodurans]ETX16634.1 invasion associated locus B family protein [Roseivivax halodurans JCM 10272]